MHETLLAIQQQLAVVISQLRSVIPNDEPIGVAQANWGFAALSRADLIDGVQALIDRIEYEGSDDIGEAGPRLTDYIRRLQFLQTHTIPQIWQNGNLALPAFVLTIGGLQAALAPVLKPDQQKEVFADIRKLTTQVRGMEARLKGLEPRTDTITRMVEGIERAYNAADRLPTDLESLEESQKKVTEILDGALRSQIRISDVRERADEIEKTLLKSTEEANSVLALSEKAYAAATSVGLAAAFAERSSSLARSMWVWVIFLIVALAAGSYFGSHRLQMLVDLFKDPTQPASVIYPNVLLSLFSVGAPIWVAWLSTKQIGQRFRLSEDYAFKASISRAYEGFRREAARIDTELEAKLLSSALNRLDEQPLRLVETESHGSPWNELANSQLVREAMRTVPNFAGQVREAAENLAQNTLSRLPGSKKAPSTSTAIPVEPPKTAE
ncbi:hypothetical protein [Bradyrhizobium sp. LA6.7]|uniref:hypothetical protein n=1 Tax=unclassified Bradyrhizobium TaxID=2631580 RepID=UPI0033987B86